MSNVSFSSLTSSSLASVLEIRSTLQMSGGPRPAVNAEEEEDMEEELEKLEEEDEEVAPRKGEGTPKK